MRVLNILNLNYRKLNHHEEVYSQGPKPETANRQQDEPSRAGNAAAVDGQSAIRTAIAGDDRASTVVDRRHARSNVEEVHRIAVDDGGRIGGRPETSQT